MSDSGDADSLRGVHGWSDDEFECNFDTVVGNGGLSDRSDGVTDADAVRGGPASK